MAPLITGSWWTDVPIMLAIGLVGFMILGFLVGLICIIISEATSDLRYHIEHSPIWTWPSAWHGKFCTASPRSLLATRVLDHGTS